MNKVDRRDKRFFDFMCSCGEEKKKRCDDVYEEVRIDLGGVTDRDFLTHLVYALQDLDNGQANIEHIYTDQWSGIAVKYQYDYKEELECEDENEQRISACKCESDPKYDCQWKTQSFWVECDRIHHGLARVYQLVRDFDATL